MELSPATLPEAIKHRAKGRSQREQTTQGRSYHHYTAAAGMARRGTSGGGSAILAQRLPLPDERLAPRVPLRRLLGGGGEGKLQQPRWLVRIEASGIQIPQAVLVRHRTTPR